MAAGRSLRKEGRYTDALSAFTHALNLAREQNNTHQTVRSLMMVATVQFLTFRYQSALIASEEALQLARDSDDYLLAGGASGTIASIHRQLGDFRTAEAEGNLAIELLKLAPKGAPHASEFLANATNLQTTLCYEQGKIREGEVFFQQSISLAQGIGDKSLEASAWDNRGVALLRDNQIELAGQSIRRAFELRKSLQDSDSLAISQEHLAELELKRPVPNYPAALKLIDQALASNSTAFKSDAKYYPINIRAQILLGLGNRLQALQEFRRAVNAADNWRLGALPGDATNTQTVVLLQKVYQDFSHLAAQISLETNDSSLRAEALQVLATNRAESLREQLTLALATDAKLPDNYFEKLSALQAAQAQVTLGRNNKDDQAALERIRMEISELENQNAIQIGKNYFSKEKNLRRNSLRDIQSRLAGNQLLISLSLGSAKSYMWAISGDQVDLFQIDKKETLEGEAAQLSKAVRDGGNIRDAGQKLGQALFGSLPARLARKPEWLIVADGALLNGVPLAALPAWPASGGGEWLLANHTLRFLPSEFLLRSPQVKPATGRFLGVADPIYNLADSRLQRKAGEDLAPVEASSVTLARLAGSAQEVRSAARQCGLPEQDVLDGRQACMERLRQALIPPPQVVHFAVHVVSPPNRPQEAALALSLINGVPELLTPEAIATFRLPGSLVVLSGCSSGRGKAVPGAGLLGLSRAWLLAGAEAVVASAWPTPDNTGRFFSAFYSHLHDVKTGSISQRAALALAQTQLEMQRGSGYTSSPSYWGAYSVISKE